MSDWSELWSPATDPKNLTPSAFISKEAQNIKNGISKLPASIQPAVDVTVNTAAELVAAAAPVAETALATLLANEVPAAQTWFVGLLAKAFGVTGAAQVNALASTAGGQTVIQQLASNVTAAVQHLGAQAQAGALAVEAVTNVGTTTASSSVGVQTVQPSNILPSS